MAFNIDIETYRSFAQTRLRDLMAMVLPERSDEVAVRIEALNGLHANSSVELEASRLVVGPNSDDDIELVDDEAMGGCVEICFRKSLFGTLVLISLDRDDVRLNGLPIMAGTNTAAQRMPCEVSINGIVLRLSLIETIPEKSRIMLEQGAVAGLAFLALLAFTGQHYMSARNKPMQLVLEDVTVAGPRSAPLPEPAPHKVGLTPERPDLLLQAIPMRQSLRDTASTLIEDAGLGEYLRIEEESARTIRITGQLPGSRMSDWRTVRARLDAASSDDAVVIANVSMAAKLTNLPPIAALRLGDAPQVIFSNGTVSGPGNPVSEGWVVDSISETRLRLRRAGEVIDIDI